MEEALWRTYLVVTVLRSRTSATVAYEY